MHDRPVWCESTGDRPARSGVGHRPNRSSRQRGAARCLRADRAIDGVDCVFGDRPSPVTICGTRGTIGIDASAIGDSWRSGHERVFEGTTRGAPYEWYPLCRSRSPSSRGSAHAPCSAKQSAISLSSGWGLVAPPVLVCRPPDLSDHTRVPSMGSRSGDRSCNRFVCRRCAAVNSAGQALLPSRPSNESATVSRPLGRDGDPSCEAMRVTGHVPTQPRRALPSQTRQGPADRRSAGAGGAWPTTTHRRLCRGIASRLGLVRVDARDTSSARSRHEADTCRGKATTSLVSA